MHIICSFIEPSGVTLACDDIQNNYEADLHNSQGRNPIKKGQKSPQDIPTIWTFTWRIGYREQSNLELNHSFFSKDH